jgi:Cd(II)/Pb(II)-responsive transcriptional regulator
MKIGELSKKTGCKVVTIRYYEKEGLLAEAERTAGNYRLYGQEDLSRLDFIMHCRKHGIKLDEIRKLLAFRDKPQHDCTWITELINVHIEDVDRQMRSLKDLKHILEQLRDRCAGRPRGKICGIIEGLDDRELCCANVRSSNCAPA